MIKQAAIYFLSFGLLSLLGYYFHTTILPTIANESPVSLMQLYLFYGLFSFILCMALFYLQKTEKFKDQLGFLYLLSVALKIVIFCIVFYRIIFFGGSYTNRQSVNLLIPMFLMIVFEVFFISKLLSKPNPLKNG